MHDKLAFVMMMLESYFVCVAMKLLWRWVDGRSNICVTLVKKRRFAIFLDW